MAVFKCKMCGGELSVKVGDKIAECQFCGSHQTISTSNDEQILKLFVRGNRLRNEGEFDKAYSVFEQIIANESDNAEAYWDLLLCKYGVTYVDDYDGKKKPTINRMSLLPITEDEDYKRVLQYAEIGTKPTYIEQANQIADIQETIMNIIKNEKAYDIFVSYKETDESGDRTKDSLLAQEIYDSLTKEGYRVFLSRISLSGVVGNEYEPYIYSALYTAKMLILVTTDVDYVNSVWVKNEWKRFIEMMKNDSNKKLIPCYKDLDAYDLPKEIRNIQGLDMSKLGFIQDLVVGVNKVFGKDKTVSAKINSTDEDLSIEIIKRLFELGEFQSASNKLKKVIEAGSTDAKVYIYKMMADNAMYSEDISIIRKIRKFYDNPYFLTALKFATPEFAQVLNSLPREQIYFNIDDNGVLIKYLGENEEIVAVPDGVSVIGERAFKGSIDVKQIILPNSVKEIKSNAFESCSMLEKINLENVEKFGSFAFRQTNIKQVIISNKIRYIGSYAFGKSVEHIEIPDVKIAFDGEYGICESHENLKYVKVPINYAKRISGNNKSTILEICEGATSIDNEQFVNKYSFKRLVLPKSLATINVSMAEVWIGRFDELEIRADNITVNAEYFLLEIKLKQIIANATVLKTVLKACQCPTKETVDAINKALVEQGEKTSNTTQQVLNTTQNVSGATSSSSATGRCYIATCVYGSYNCPEVWTLRRYRDDVLGATWYGRFFVKTYYAISPKLVKYFGNKTWFKKLWRGRLDNMVKHLQEKGIESTAYEDKKW